MLTTAEQAQVVHKMLTLAVSRLPRRKMVEAIDRPEYAAATMHLFCAHLSGDESELRAGVLHALDLWRWLG